MIIIAGLGNPENRYISTRHNTGFLVIDRLASRLGAVVTKSEGRALTGTGVIAGKRILLAKPQTWMNLSGESLQALTAYYRTDPETELLVIADDIHLPMGMIRLRSGGSAGGHNGLKNIILMLGTDRFPRLRVGVGEGAPGENLIPHVLGRFSREDWPVMDEAIERAADAAALFVTEGIRTAMNRFNVRIKEAPVSDVSPEDAT